MDYIQYLKNLLISMFYTESIQFNTKAYTCKVHTSDIQCIELGHDYRHIGKSKLLPSSKVSQIYIIKN